MQAREERNIVLAIELLIDSNGARPMRMVSTGLSVALEQVLVPQAFMAAEASSAAPPAPAVIAVPVVLFSIWALGAAAVLFS
jgi:hypothetical protein